MNKKEETTTIDLRGKPDLAELFINYENENRELFISNLILENENLKLKQKKAKKEIKLLKRSIKEQSRKEE